MVLIVRNFFYAQKMRDELFSWWFETQMLGVVLIIQNHWWEVLSRDNACSHYHPITKQQIVMDDDNRSQTRPSTPHMKIRWHKNKRAAQWTFLKIFGFRLCFECFSKQIWGNKEHVFVIWCFELAIACSIACSIAQWQHTNNRLNK